VHGERVYQANCAACHGAGGHGDGPAVHAQAVFPADLTVRRVLDYRDGDLFWFAGHAVVMAADDQWDVVDYLRAHNSGEFVRTSNRGSQPLVIPGFNVSCADGRNFRPDDLRGHVLRLTSSFGRDSNAIAPDIDRSLISIVLPEPGATAPRAAGCVAQPEAREALAILLGTTPAGMVDAELLVDPNGWLRARWKPGEPGGWQTPERLSVRVHTLAEHPLPPAATSGHVHHH
jgi:Cytochrome C oxidase, cbb3-type, subunit III